MRVDEFLLARIAEDEEWVARGECRCGEGWPQKPDCPDRIEVECDAKRQIVEEWRNAKAEGDAGDMSGRIAAFALSLAVGALAAVYADHPDYDPEWRA